MMYPKFHCECNWIERYWGSAKREARINYDYTYKSSEKNLIMYLDKVSPAKDTLTEIRRYYKRVWRYIEAYSKNMSGHEADQKVCVFLSRKYISHRRIGIYD